MLPPETPGFPYLELPDGTRAPLPLEMFAPLVRGCFPALCAEEVPGTVRLGSPSLALVLDSRDPVQNALASWALNSAARVLPFPSAEEPAPEPEVPLQVREAGPANAEAAVFDLETADAGTLFTRPVPDTGFVRLAGVRDSSGSRIVPPGKLLEGLLAAREICGHNIMGFDLLALVRHHGASWEALSGKARDTLILARQYDPPRSREAGVSTDRYDLDHVAERLGIPGKSDDLRRLKKKYGGWDRIPADDPEYRSYLEGDLEATARVAEALPRDGYTDREHKVAAIAGRMTLNGFAVDTGLLQRRYDEGQERKRKALEALHDVWGLPLGKTVSRGRGKARHDEFQKLDSPLSASSGREWIAGIWERYGIPDPPRTGTGKLSIGADDLKQVAADSRCPRDLRSLITLVGIVVGTRTVYQTALDNLCPDGRVHPLNSFRQASGRWSVTDPGLTVFGKRGGKHVERDIFLPDAGHVLLSFDLSQVDMRAIGWLSGDRRYRELFAPGKDAHQEIANQVGVSRQDAKAIGHGWNYGLGERRMVANGLDPGKVRAFTRGMESRFPVLIAWREEIRQRGKAGEILLNGFGRRMRCEQSRAYTVAPALMGQGGARDIMTECLLRLPPDVLPMLRVMVHDEILLSVPRELVPDVVPAVRSAMTWNLDDDLRVTCDMAQGSNWVECSAK